MYTLLIILATSALADNQFDFFQEHWKINKNIFKAVIKENVLSQSDVDNEGDKTQKFDMRVIAYHPKQCKKVLRKLSKFERYPKMVGFIKSAEYQEKHQFLTVTADHTLLPFPMVVHIITKRPTEEGSYNFRFPTGIFPGLKGKFVIKEIDQKCSVYGESKWEGKHTGIPNFAIELFSETLMKIAVETLIRKT